MILDLILNSFGLTTIDDTLQNLIEGIAKFPKEGMIAKVHGWANLIGLCIAIGVGSYECYMMMLGRRGMDVMKLLRIVIISMCISFSSWICDAAAIPGKEISALAKELAMAEQANVEELEESVQDQLDFYLLCLQAIQNEAEMQKKTDDRTWWETAWDYATGGVIGGLGTEGIDEITNNTKQMIAKAAITVESKITSWINQIIKFICELLFQVSYFGMLMAQNIFMIILEIFCPIAFAMSLAPPYRSAWSQWLSKYISLSLWGFIIYIIFYYVCYIMQYSLELDMVSYQELCGQAWEKRGTNDALDMVNLSTVKSIGAQQIGTTIMYVIGLLLGVFLLKFVPEVASWLIPGGVSSGAGSMSGSMTGGAVAAAGAVAGGAGAVGAQAGKNLQPISENNAKLT